MVLRCDHRLRLCRGCLGGGDGVILEHPIQHPVTPRFGRVRIAEWVVIVRRLRQRRQERGLAQIELVEGFVEISLRRGGDAIGVQTQVDLVEVQLQHPLLGQRLVDPHRQDRFLGLARQRYLVVQQHVLGDLLGDGRGADRPAPLAHMCHIERGGAQDGQRIDPGMGPKILVLGRDEGLFHQVRDRGVGNEKTSLGGEIGDQARVGRKHPGHHRGLVVAQPVHIWKVGAEVEVGHIAAHPHRQHSHHPEREQRAQSLADPATAGSGLLRRAWETRRTARPFLGARRRQTFASFQGFDHRARYGTFLVWPPANYGGSSGQYPTIAEKL